jgi:hypothetical protein
MRTPTFATIVLTSLLLLGAGCARPTKDILVPPAPPEKETVSFGAPITLGVGEDMTYEDGLVVTLLEINDSRCPADVVCIWQGELSALLSVSGGTAGDAASEVRVGTVTAPTTTSSGYVFTLEAATEDFIDLLVAPASPEASADYSDLIHVTSPASNAAVTSPLEITGEARGTWYFEASFPIRLLDADGNEIAAHYAMAQTDWMTTDFVPFTATLEFDPPATATGTLILENDNPSGLPEHAKHIEIPVTF